MGKRRGRRKGRPNKFTKGIGEPAPIDKNKNTDLLPPVPAQQWRQQSLYRRFLEHARLYTAILASLVAIISASWAYFPSLSIDPTVVVTDKKPSSVDFTVKNIGRLTVYDLVFGCEIKHPGGGTLKTEGNVVITPEGIMAQGVAELAPGKSATRSCDVGAPLPDIGYPASTDFTVHFKWPFINKADSVTRHFTTRRDENGHPMIVPDSP